MSRDGSIFQLAFPQRPNADEYAKALQAIKSFNTILDDEEVYDALPDDERKAMWAANKAAKQVVASNFGIVYVQLTLHYPIDIGEAIVGTIGRTDRIYIYEGNYDQPDEDGYDISTVMAIEPVDFSNPDVKLLVGDNPAKCRTEVIA